MQKLVWKIKVWAGKVVRLILQAIFRFDRWHVFTLTEKQYAKDIIAYCNGRQERNVMGEIGCGLGDIIRHTRYKEKIGYDLDDRILRAASLLSKISGKGHTRFARFSFPDSPLEGNYDVILLVNWIHLIEPAVLKEKIEEYFTVALNSGGAIILDTVEDPEYKYNHNVYYLTGDIPATVSELGDYERQRHIWLIKK